MLNPGGLVLVDGSRLHCESEGVLLEAGTPVKIVAVKGNRVVVRLVDWDSEKEDTGPRLASTDGDSPLDFDLPPS
jgi:membrane-bound ClpP family serine protease